MIALAHDLSSLPGDHYLIAGDGLLPIESPLTVLEWRREWSLFRCWNAGSFMLSDHYWHPAQRDWPDLLHCVRWQSEEEIVFFWSRDCAPLMALLHRLARHLPMRERDSARWHADFLLACISENDAARRAAA